MKLALLLIPFALYGQPTGNPCVPSETSACLHVTGQLQSRDVSGLDFGRLQKGLRGADWTVSVDPPVPIKVSMSWILQRVHIASGISVLSRASSLAAMQDAQGRSPRNKIVAISSGAISGFGACEGAHICGTSNGWTYALAGAYGLGLLIQYIIPALPSHSLQTAAAVMPDPISLDGTNLYTQPGMIIVELGKHVAEPGPLDETIQVTIPK